MPKRFLDQQPHQNDADAVAEKNKKGQLPLRAFFGQKEKERPRRENGRKIGQKPRRLAAEKDPDAIPRFVKKVREHPARQKEQRKVRLFRRKTHRNILFAKLIFSPFSR